MLEARNVGSTLTELAKSLAFLSDWTWDGRFSAALVEFPTDQGAEVLRSVGSALPQRWENASIAEAPEDVRRLVRHLGGLMAGQFLLVSDPVDAVRIYVAWWPWGNGQTISVRVGLFDSVPEQEFILRKAFGIR